MQSFRYKAYRADGTIDSDTISAASEQAAYQSLSRSGKIPFDLRPAAKKKSLAGNKQRASFRLYNPRTDNARFFSELAVLLQSGFTISQAIAAMQEDSDNPADAERLAEVAKRLQEGSSVAAAFRQDTIPEDVIALISAGENSGNLPKVATAIAQRFELASKRRTETQEALLYPIFLVIMLFAAVLILAFFLVPAIEPIFEGRSGGTPVIVSALSGLRSVLDAFGLWIAASALLFTGLAVLSEPLRQRLKRCVDFLPYVGAFRWQAAIANYLSVLHLLVSNDVPMKEAMRLAADSAPEGPLRTLFLQAEDKVASGARLYEAFAQTGLFGHAMIAHVRIGEESNNLPTMLERGAASLILKQKLRIDRLLKFLTPAITIAIGLMIGALVTSVMGTLLSVNDLAVQ